MTRWLLISEEFPGNVMFQYDKRGYLVQFEVNSTEIGQDAHAELLQSMGHFLTDNQLLEWAKGLKKNVKRVKIDLSFDLLWHEYGSPRDRHICEPLWNKMPDLVKYAVLVNLKAYNRYCKRNPQYSKLNPKSYLRGHYKNDWDKVPDFGQAKAA